MDIFKNKKLMGGLAVAVVAALAVVWRRRRGEASLAGIGAYDEPVASEVLGGVARRPSDG